MKIKVGIVGSTGYAGNELLRILLKHPYVEITAISSHSYVGKTYDEVYLNYTDICTDVLVQENEVIEKADIIFTCLHSGLSESVAEKCLNQGKIMIDLGSDLRLADQDEHKKWYGLDFNCPKVHENAVYCIPELHRRKLPGAKLIANPGCYPTSAGLALAPLVVNKLIDTKSIIIDAKSGVTGAGRTPTETTHYCEVNEGLLPYKIAAHRHVPEIEQTLNELAGEKLHVTFVPHLLPVNRGILSTIYVNLKDENNNQNDIFTLYKDFYKNDKFVRILKQGQTANLKSVKYSNYCDISLHFDEVLNRIIIISTIDNTVKGAAGQAVQNMNITLSIPEETGLDYIPPSF